MTVFVLEDDNIILEGLRYSLIQEGYEVISATTVALANEIIDRHNNIDICLLDIMLPDGNGYDVCKKIRSKGDVPIIFLTACADEVNTVMALEIGGDDYIAKPFRVRELLARMKAILRRTSSNQVKDSAFIVGNNEVNVKTGKVYCNQKEVVLTSMEYKLLLVFLNHRGHNMSRGQILDYIWDDVGDFVNDNTLTVYVKRLREKLGATNDNPIIRTVRGIGYRMD